MRNALSRHNPFKSGYGQNPPYLAGREMAHGVLTGVSGRCRMGRRSTAWLCGASYDIWEVNEDAGYYGEQLDTSRHKALNSIMPPFQKVPHD